jgi:hypothetical protein
MKTKPNAKATRSTDPLVGKHFHTLKDGKIHYQGQIMSKAGDDQYIVDLFSFLTGMCTCQRMYSLADMKDWLLYDTQADMMHSHDHGVASRMKP